MSPDYEQQWPDVNVHVLIISTEGYIVCLDERLNIDWKTSDQYDQTGHADLAKFNSILNGVAFLETKPIDYLTDSTKTNFKRMLGESIARALDHDYENAEIALEHAKNFLTDRNREKSREWYLKASGATTLSVATNGLLLWMFRACVTQITGETVFLIILTACMGGIGSFFSICLRLGDSKIEAHSDENLHLLEASFRVISGMVGALFVGLLVKLGVILPIFQDSKDLALAMIAMGFIAGASERLVPSLISNVENSVSEKKEEKTRG